VACGKDARPPFAIPDYVLEVMPRAEEVKAFFYDGAGSVWMIYDFTKQEQRLFLSEITCYTYPSNGEFHRRSEALGIETISYTPEGVAHQRIDDKTRPEIEAIDRDSVDVTSHWRNIPEFGYWAPLGRLER
jgi:hypothetical protein